LTFISDIAAALLSCTAFSISAYSPLGILPFKGLHTQLILQVTAERQKKQNLL
jgi:hypothetical protein